MSGSHKQQPHVPLCTSRRGEVCVLLGSHGGEAAMCQGQDWGMAGLWEEVENRMASGEHFFFVGMSDVCVLAMALWVD
jgi:hypothetical protein